MSLPGIAADPGPQPQTTRSQNFVPYEIMICDATGIHQRTIMLHKTCEYLPGNRLAHLKIPTLFFSEKSALDYFNPSPLNELKGGISSVPADYKFVDPSGDIPPFTSARGGWYAARYDM